MKWYKHISDSLDDPFIFDLMTEFGSDGYVVFFGVLEIYSREFSPENGWNLVISWSFLHQKLRVSSSKVKKILSKIYKWEVVDNGSQVSIYIPKFKELMDEWTLRKLGSGSGVTPKILSTDKDTDKDNTPIAPKKKGAVYSEDFKTFYSAYPKKKAPDKAWAAWKKRNGSMPHIDILLDAIAAQKNSEEWQKDGGQFIPYPATWLNAGRWADEVAPKKVGGW